MSRRVRVRIDRIVAQAAGLPQVQAERLRELIRERVQERLRSVDLRGQTREVLTRARVAGGALGARETRNEQSLAGALAERVTDAIGLARVHARGTER
jgi:hypothetical protein